MSSAPSDTGPSCNIHGFDGYDTSYQKYTNQGYHASGQAKLSIKQKTTNYQYGSPFSPLLQELQQHCSHSAAFDSAARFDPPRCAESTRLQIIQSIEEWTYGDGHTDMPSGLFWLHGGAGVGKSALAQSISEKFQDKGQLAASFFFFRSDATRIDGARLIPTLVSHLVHSFKGIGPLVEDQIRKNPVLFTKNYQIQIQELLVEPLRTLKSQEARALVTHPRLIVIDGLDECEKPEVQSELLRVIAHAVAHIPYPLRFFITSRPEAHIASVFNHDPMLQAIPFRKYNLSNDPDADRDIRKFLEDEFMRIRRVHCLGVHLPGSWPDQKAISSLVERSSGHFIYASTVIRYIGSPKHRPDDRLEVILRLRPPREGDRPYAQLDALYTFIFQNVEDHDHLEKICLVLGILYFRSKGVRLFHGPKLRYTIIEDSLGMKSGDLVLLLDPILSLVAIDDGHVRILHKSLFDYLLDFTRGGHLPFDLARVHELAATYTLKHQIVEGKCDENTLRDFAYHCQYACLNDTLKDYLHSLAAPPSKPVMAALRAFCGWSDKANESMRHTMWHVFRTLSRQDFDSTGQIYEQYGAKWMDIFRSAAAGPTQRQINMVDRLERWLRLKFGKTTAESEMDKLKRELDTLLMEWKPQRFTAPVDIGMEPVKLLASIKQEHSVFSAHTEAFFAGQPIVSSLVFGEYFIYSYEVVVGQELFLDLRIYSRHDNRCWDYTRHWYDKDRGIVQETLTTLGTVEKHLFSDFFQKYGLASDEDTFKT